MNHVSRAPASRNQTAFTLVELLVVIGIIALLISILLPSLNRAREAAKAVKCAANLHVAAQAMQLYLQDNKGMLPIGYWDGTCDPKSGATLAGNALTRKTNWALLLLNSLNRKIPTNAYEVGQQAGSGGVYTAIQSLQCPSVPNDGISKTNQVMVHLTAHPRIFANLGTGNTVDPATGKLWTTIRASRIKRSSEIATLFDGSLVIDPQGFYYAAYDVPVAQGLDNGKLKYGDSTGTTFLTDNMSLASYNPPKNTDPVSMTGFYGNVAAANTDDANSSAPLNANNIRFRHNGNVSTNVMMFDGHVQTFRYNKGDHSTDLLRGNINVSY